MKEQLLLLKGADRAVHLGDFQDSTCRKSGRSPLDLDQIFFSARGSSVIGHRVAEMEMKMKMDTTAIHRAVVKSGQV